MAYVLCLQQQHILQAWHALIPYFLFHQLEHHLPFLTPP